MKRLIFKLAVAAILALPELLSASSFRYNINGGDVGAGFRKTGSYTDTYESVGNFGDFTNFLKLAPGSTIVMSNVSPSQLKDCFSEGNSNLQWSAWSTLNVNFSTAYGTFPNYTLLFTLPNGTNLSTQTVPPARDADTEQAAIDGIMLSCEQGAVNISGYLASNQDNTIDFVREVPLTYPQDTLSAFIGDSDNPADGDFGGGDSVGFPFEIENVNPVIFNAARRSDFYLSVPASSDQNGSGNTYIDPLTGLTNGVSDFIGYFIFNVNGTMTYTRAFTVTASATTGAAPLQVVFTTSATSSSGATNWIWNFGNGTIITNTTSVNATNTYNSGGNYTVTLTINGPTGPSVLTFSNNIAVTATVTPQPNFSKVAPPIGGKFVFNGTNGTPTAQFRILMATNLPAVTWTPVYTNFFLANGSFSYTNSSATNKSAFFRVVSP